MTIEVEEEMRGLTCKAEYEAEPKLPHKSDSYHYHLQREVCRTLLSSVPVYSVNALSHQFLKGLLLRAFTFILWVLMFLYNSFTEIWGVKEAVLVGFKFGLVPVVLGGSLMDHCTLPMFGIGMTISRKLEFLAAYPFTVVLYWICGFLFLTMASHSIQNVMIVRLQALCYLPDLRVTNCKNTKLHIRQHFSSIAFHGAVMASVVTGDSTSTPIIIYTTGAAYGYVEWIILALAVIGFFFLKWKLKSFQSWFCSDTYVTKKDHTISMDSISKNVKGLADTVKSVEEDLRDKIEKVNMKLESVSNSTADTRSQVKEMRSCLSDFGCRIRNMERSLTDESRYSVLDRIVANLDDNLRALHHIGRAIDKGNKGKRSFNLTPGDSQNIVHRYSLKAVAEERGQNDEEK